MGSKIQRQLELEAESVELGVARYREQMAKRELKDLPPGLALMNRSIEPMAKAVAAFIEPPKKGAGRLETVRKFFRQIDPVETAYITARILINVIEEETPLQGVAIVLGKALVDHVEYLRFKKENPNYLHFLEQDLNRRGEHPERRRRVLLGIKRKIGIKDLEIETKEKFYIGLKALELFIQSTGLIKKERSSYGPSGSPYIIRATDELRDWIFRQHARCELMYPVLLPMIVKPIPWKAPYGGGFLTNKQLTLVKTNNREYLDELANHDMPLVYRAINALQDTPWRINKRILKVMQEAKKADSGIGKLPVDWEEPMPPAPWSSDEEFEYLKENYPEVIKSWNRRAKEVWERRQQNRSRLKAFKQKLWIAEKFQDEEEIYFVWTMDWRGRLYPAQPMLNPQSDDIGKALLEFAEGKPIGESGLRWLMIHLATKWGLDKAPMQERIEWVHENHDQILRWAEDPLGDRGWEDADSPWQFLAAVFEYAEVFTSGLLYAYESHLPIAMDGSCNGLQNFSAMLRDEVGGKATNLVPMDRPQDVYTEVLNVVVPNVEADAAAEEELAKVWLGKIDRGIVKRNVMTMPYGVTLFGMKDQIRNELAKRNGPDGKYLDIHNDNAASLYLAQRIWEAVGTVVVAARQTMDWLQTTARVAAKANVPIRWITPSGFLVQQFYSKAKNVRIDTLWGAVRARYSLNFPTDKVDSRKQALGISPNFVHSMDASHLVLTVNKALDAGITSFAMVHDSYGTHAADAETLAYLLREAFVEMYTQHDVLEEFRQGVLRQIPEELHEEVPEVPPKGSLDLSAVKDSLYFFA